MDEDTALIERCGRGDGEAFAALVDRHGGRALRMARRVLGNGGEAEDAVQEAFLALWRKAPSWNPTGPAGVSTWLVRVALNKARDIARKTLPVDAGDVETLRDEHEDIEARVLRDEREALLAEAITDLPERQRLALALVYGEGFSRARAAGALGIGAGALEQLLVRAKRTLRERIGERRHDRSEEGDTRS